MSTTKIEKGNKNKTKKTPQYNAAKNKRDYAIIVSELSKKTGKEQSK